MENNHNEIIWQSPSNIALIKYWGKYGKQLPQNPSLSFTLKNSKTTTKLNWQPKNLSDYESPLEFYFDGERYPHFEERVKRVVSTLEEDLTCLKNVNLRFYSENSFPHSVGIASSASGISSLVLCLLSLEKEIGSNQTMDEDFFKKASFCSRLGSGSACRSVYGGVVSWGSYPENEMSSEEYSMPESDIHNIYKDFQDTILIVDKTPKALSSSDGHGLMMKHRFALCRYRQARKNFNQILTALKVGDVETFGRIVEEEALTLHSLIMTSNPSYILMKPNSLKIIETVRNYRKETSIPIYFTLDAGPNIHLLYPKRYKERVEGFINEDLLCYTTDNMKIDDEVGLGPAQLR